MSSPTKKKPMERAVAAGTLVGEILRFERTYGPCDPAHSSAMLVPAQTWARWVKLAGQVMPSTPKQEKSR